MGAFPFNKSSIANLAYALKKEKCNFSYETIRVTRRAIHEIEKLIVNARETLYPTATNGSPQTLKRSFQ